MKFSETPNDLTITETPGCLWLFGFFFAAVGAIFVYGSLGGASNWGEVPVWVNGMAFVMGSIGLITGIVIIRNAPLTLVRIDKLSRQVTYITRGILGKKVRTFNHSEFREFCLLEDEDSDGDPVYSFGMELVNGESIKISSLESPSEAYKRNFVYLANRAIGKENRSIVDAALTGTDPNE